MEDLEVTIPPSSSKALVYARPMPSIAQHMLEECWRAQPVLARAESVLDL